MKTWWNYLYLVVLAIILPFIAGLLPTVQLKGKYVGGGPTREYFVNLVASILPPEKADILINHFMQASIVKEILLYLPIAINLSAIALLIVYALGTISIEVNNYVKTSIYKSQRQKAKGA